MRRGHRRNRICTMRKLYTHSHRSDLNATGSSTKTVSVSRGMVWSTFGDTKRIFAIGQQGQCGRAVKVIERLRPLPVWPTCDGCERALSPRDDQERRAFNDSSGPDGTFSGTGTSEDDVAVHVRRPF